MTTTAAKAGISPQDMLNAGYKPHIGPCAFNHSDAIYQKAIRLNGKNLYFLNAWYYDRDKYPQDGFSWRHGWQVESRLFLSDGNGFDVDFLGLNDAGIEKMEVFFKHVYDRMHCVPDLHNND